jgi:hypothetical protein
LSDALRRNDASESKSLKRAGFHAYRIIDSGNYELATMTAFETKEGADASDKKAREWVNANFSDLAKERVSAISAEQVFSELA